MRKLIPSLILFTSGALHAQFGVFPPTGGGVGVGATNVTCTAAGPVTTVACDITSMSITAVTLKTLVVQCWTGTGTDANGPTGTLTALPATIASRTTTSVTPTFSSSSNVGCIVNSNGGAGATGPTGGNGAAGATGATGTNGTNGTNGANGATGAAGTTGTNGTNGTNGAVGTTGSTGPAGTTGVTGATGAGGSGNMISSVVSVDPTTAACTPGITLQLNTAASPPNLWVCGASSGTWLFIPTTAGTGTGGVSLTEGTCASITTPSSSAFQTIFINSVNHHVTRKDSTAACTDMESGGGAGSPGVGRNSLTATWTAIADGNVQEQTATWTGVLTTDTVILGSPSGLPAGLIATARVSASNTVAIRLLNISGAPVTPGALTFNGTLAIYNLSGAGTLDFGSIPDGGLSVLTFTLTGVLAGDPVSAKWPSTLEAGLFGMMRASAADTIEVRLANFSGAAVNPASQSFGASVAK